MDTHQRLHRLRYYSQEEDFEEIPLELQGGGPGNISPNDQVVSFRRGRGGGIKGIRRGGGAKPSWVSCPHVGLLYAFLSALFFAFNPIFVKLVSGTHWLELALARFLTQLLCITPVMVYCQVPFLPMTDKKRWLVARGVIGTLGMSLLVLSFQRMQVGDAMVIFFTNSLFTGVFGHFFLKEPLGVIDLLLLMFSLVGVVLVIQPPFLFSHQLAEYSSDKLIGSLSALASALCAGAAYTCIAKMRGSVHYAKILFYQSLIGVVLAGVALLAIDGYTLPPCGVQRLYIMAFGLVSIGGQTLLTRALQVENVLSVSIVRTLDCLFSYLLQFLILGDNPNLLGGLGGACIILAASCTIIKKWVTSRKKVDKP